MTDYKQIEKSREINLSDSELNKKHLAWVFLACLVFCTVIYLMRTVAPALVNDDIATMFGAARLAGLDWSGVTDGYWAYHGQAYYIFFTPLFLITENPEVRMLIIYTANVIVLSCTGTLIFYMAVTFFGFRNRWDTVMLPLLIILLTITTFGTSGSLSNEVPIFMTVWIVCLILVKLLNTQQRSKRILLTVLLILTLGYGLLLHTRLIGMVLAIVLAVLIYFAIFRKWVVSPLVFFPGMIAGYLGVNLVLSHIYSTQYGGRTAEEIGNTPAVLERLLNISDLPSIKAIVDTIIGNIYTLTVSTYGLAIVAVVFALYLVYRMVLSLKKRRLASFCDDVGLPKEQFYILLTFGICIIGTILGICMMWWGHSVDRMIETGNLGSSWDARGLYYTRYFEHYFGPILLVLYRYLCTKRKTASKLCIIAFATHVIMYTYIRFGILSYTGKIHAYAFPIWPIGYGSMEVMAVFIALLLAVYAFCLHRDYVKYIAMIILTFTLVFRVSTMSWPFFSVQVRADTRPLYLAIDGIRQKTQLPYEIYTEYHPDRIQYLFSHNRVIDGVPDENVHGDSVFIWEVDEEEQYVTLYEYGYTPHNVYSSDNAHLYVIWLRGDSLNEAMREHAGENR